MRKTLHWMKKIPTDRGVRRVPISHRSLTGEVDGKEFESALERDLMLLMRFDERVDWFQPQPVQIDYEFPAGQERHYTPDLLVHFTPFADGSVARPLLCEVKYRADLAKDWRELRMKFKAAKAYCKRQNWDFQIFHEGRIRSVKLANVQFLWMYKAADFDRELASIIFQLLKDAGGPVPMMPLLRARFSSEEELGAAIWAWWCLVAQRQIICDLTLPLSGDTLFWLVEWRYSCSTG